MENKYALLLLIFIVGSYAFLTSTELGTSGQTQTLPLLYRMMNSEYLVTDWYVNEVASFDVRFYFNHFLLFVNTLFENLDQTVLFLHVFSYVLFYLSLFYLTRLFFKDEKKALFVTMLVFIGYPLSLGATSFLKANLSPNGLAWALIFLSIYLYFKQKEIWSYIVLGAATLIDLADAFPVVGLFIGDVLLSRPFSLKRKLILLLQSLPFWIISSFILVPLYLTNVTTPLISAAAAEIISKFYFRHISPFSWGLLEVLPFGLMFLFFLFHFKSTDLDKNHKSTIRHFIIVVIAYFLAGTVFVEFYPLAQISKIMIFRMSKIITLFAYVILGNYLYQKIMAAQNKLEKYFYIFMPLMFIYPLLVIPAVPVLFIPELLTRKFHFNVFEYITQNKRRMGIFFSLLVVFLISLIAVCSKLLSPQRTALNSLIPYVILPSALYLLAFFCFIIATKKVRILAVLLLLSASLAVGPFNYYLHPQSYTDGELDLFESVREKTPPTSMFLTPFMLNGFRVLANRSIVIDIYSGPFTDLGVVQWYLRMRDISNNDVKGTEDFSVIDSGYNSLTVSDLQRLQQKYHFDYVVFKKQKLLPLERIYHNDEFVVYKVDQEPEDGG